jgi:hypothetical protein
MFVLAQGLVRPPQQGPGGCIKQGGLGWFYVCNPVPSGYHSLQAEQQFPQALFGLVIVTQLILIPSTIQIGAKCRQ